MRDKSVWGTCLAVILLGCGAAAQQSGTPPKPPEGEPVDTDQALFVVKVLKHQHPELKEVATEIETKLRQQKLDAEIDDLKKRAGVWMDEDYFKGKPVATPPSATQPPASPR